MIIQVESQGIKVLNKKCWRCNTESDLTLHHAIPKYLKPVKNVEIPLCKDCHEELHGQDMNCLRAFAYKIMKTLKESYKQMCSLQGLLAKKKNRDETMTVGDVIKK